MYHNNLPDDLQLYNVWKVFQMPENQMKYPGQIAQNCAVIVEALKPLIREKDPEIKEKAIEKIKNAWNLKIIQQENSPID